MDVERAKEYVVRYLSVGLNTAFHYHDLSHTLDVFESSARIGKLEKIHSEDLILLETAALFHDIGMTKQYDDHETASEGIARSVLPGFGYNPEAIEKICKLIMATKMPVSPFSLPEQILCDADLDYLGRNDFFMRSFQLQMEWQHFGVLCTDTVGWLRYEADFLSRHEFNTKSAHATRDTGKQKNLSLIQTFLKSEK